MSLPRTARLLYNSSRRWSFRQPQHFGASGALGISSRRAAGILAHPTSFPSPFGIGDLGPTAFRFLHWLAGANVTVWQVLPLGPTDEYGSPYRSLSAFAGNPLLISPERLVEDGLLGPEELEAAQSVRLTLPTLSTSLRCRTGSATSCSRHFRRSVTANPPSAS